MPLPIRKEPKRRMAEQELPAGMLAASLMKNPRQDLMDSREHLLKAQELLGISDALRHSYEGALRRFETSVNHSGSIA